MGRAENLLANRGDGHIEGNVIQMALVIPYLFCSIQTCQVPYLGKWGVTGGKNLILLWIERRDSQEVNDFRVDIGVRLEG